MSANQPPRASRLAARAVSFAFSVAALAAISAASVQGQPQSTRSGRTSAEASYLAENDAAMSRMMKGMAIAPSGDVDRDFVDMMVPHHQGAIDMAVAVLRYGHNPQVRRLAQEIIVDQQQEIAAMRLAVGEPLPPSAPSPTGPPAPSASPAPGMDMR
jgi:uncharacterized protein (DUF305 family)